ncbi:acyl-CoA dehydrogenase family protein [Caulobacter mirabilis]|uniref:Acyl-CoA dehydrogenase n=1 Tax=Caulobacter mirabilis TaxID=69666 RepID=A0A2D2AV94_9CAUL|nr:acyl-CoA dehydrogenase family protein [Caulobacter mirabilis]ATQ41952.1 acyl-CoA dehydrogenase [Caulobacter mirabilis]
MALALSAADLAFRDEVRRFLDEKLTDDLREAGRLCAGIYCDRPVAQRWLSILNDRGWATPNWPVEYGGTGWSLVQRYVFASELIAADAPPVTPNATGMLGPVLIAFGTDAQKARYLPAIKTGEDWWAQGYSEPGAGSDLAALQCRAARDGDHYVVNGSKIWTSHAQWSNRIFCLVRTSSEGKPQQGISFLLFDMDLPGVSVRPIITLAGDHEVNAVFFDNVRVPIEGLVGREHDGWTVAKHLLTHERGGQWSPRLRKQWSRLARMLAARPDGDPGEIAALRRRLAELAVQLDAQEANEHQILSTLSAGGSPGPASSMLKMQGTELLQKLDELGLVLAGAYAAADQSQALHGLNVQLGVGPVDAITNTSRYLNNRAATIYAGSSEVQRNILAGQLLKG